ncbi:MAG: hypothetical protein JSV30_03350 [Candidatus Omnitrophota bacterium]|nr:MAG: hypothetical protein JSV30_03350 [Candidatus Omnitrophota bacterium]
MGIKKILAYLIGIAFAAVGGMYGVKGAAVTMCWIIGGKERVTRLLCSMLPFKELKMIELIGIILGAAIGMFLCAGLWAFIMWKTGWLTVDEIMRFIDKKWKG